MKRVRLKFDVSNPCDWESQGNFVKAPGAKTARRRDRQSCYWYAHFPVGRTGSNREVRIVLTVVALDL